LVFEDHEYNPSFADPPIDHAAYTDPRKLDRTEPRSILSPYPELWAQWQAEMDSPYAYDEYCSGGIFRMHSARFLRDVVRQHVWLTDGPGDAVLFPAGVREVFAERVAVIVANAHPSYGEMRQRFLADPWKRASRRHYIRLYYIPDYLERDIKAWDRQLDPFSPESLQRRQLAAAIFGGRAEVREAGNDEVIARRDAAPSKPSRVTASSN
jgi:hypothetical protein